MPYSPATIANYFLHRASKEGRALTTMQVFKLVYIAHGWYLGFRKQPLIDEPVEAWQHGPAIRSLYNKIKKYGSGAVTELLPVNWFSLPTPPWANVTNIDKSTAEILDSVWNSCGHFGGIQLSEMTHKEGTPWWQVWNGRESKDTDVISNDLIQEFYEQKIKAHSYGKLYEKYRSNQIQLNNETIIECV
ncbi:Panacea domain-containing protein [Xylella fastidiosa]|uniref:Panacea domain-containing protein n=1 Tax=Xylella fastidiosa TaxID=2371 RepID=UPI000B4C468A|nr:type II toxin-antitoxin system antitoxin SocA domain-containing protein [Xylella fastidiosa]ALR08720.2 hypothetical protein XFFB_05250 [Xylella fastidiosa]WGZ33010.1 DUF4065 domain-containing protein [Xylella fastidiosa subsp. pauca]WGZ35367.1 DUF4065 domain-containing protein [Xylella fastidiosa subsp. pauca]WGZ37638.1 DUF4065 domain-containing protein [Xylella fastidiosa subsp. pauca]